MGTQLPRPKKGTTAPPLFGAYLFWPNDWMRQDTTWYEVGLGPGDIVVDGNPAPSTERGTAALHFSAHFALAQSPISTTDELLFSYDAFMMSSLAQTLLIKRAMDKQTIKTKNVEHFRPLVEHEDPASSNIGDVIEKSVPFWHLQNIVTFDV